MANVYTPVAGTNITDASGNKLQLGIIRFQLVAVLPTGVAGGPIDAELANGSGIATSAPIVVPVQNGAFSVTLADTSTTTPTNPAYTVEAFDSSTGAQVLGVGYETFQPSGSATIDFDSVPPNLAAMVTVQRGADGQSAYQLAVANGFVGTVTAWLASLVGSVTAAASQVLSSYLQLTGAGTFSVASYPGVAASLEDVDGRIVADVAADGTLTVTKLAIPFNGNRQPVASLIAGLAPSATRTKLLARVGTTAGWPALMATPPAIGTPSLTSSLSGATLDPWNSPNRVNLFGTTQQYGSNGFMQWVGVNYGAGASLANGSATEFVHTGTRLELVLRGSGCMVPRVFVNGKLTNPLPVLTGTGTTSIGSKQITGVSNAANFQVGYSLAMTGIPPGTTVTGSSGTTLNVSLPANQNGSATLTGTGPQPRLAGDGNLYYLLVDFTAISSSPVQRTIRIEGDGFMQFGGVNLLAGETIAAPSTTPRAVVGLMGDSFIEGLAGVTYPCGGMSYALGRAFDWDMHSLGVGGTGPLNPEDSPRVNFLSRMSDLTSIPNLALGIILYSQNDFGSYLGDLSWSGAPTTYEGIAQQAYAATVSMIAAFQMAKPGVPLILLGPQGGGAPPLLTLTVCSEAVRKACSEYAGVYFVNQYDRIRLTGTGNIGAPASTSLYGSGTATYGGGDAGNADRFVNVDGVHPSQFGHEDYGFSFLADPILRIVQTL